MRMGRVNGRDGNPLPNGPQDRYPNTPDDQASPADEQPRRTGWTNAGSMMCWAAKSHYRTQNRLPPKAVKRWSAAPCFRSHSRRSRVFAQQIGVRRMEGRAVIHMQPMRNPHAPRSRSASAGTGINRQL